MKNYRKNKIFRLKGLTKELDNARRHNKTIVLAGGTFDLLHWGHIKALEHWSGFGDILVVHIDSDKSVKEKKGERRPVISEQKRAFSVAALECVDYVFISDLPTYDNLIVSNVRPNMFVRVRRTHFTEKQNVQRANYFNNRYKGSKMIFVDPVKGISTTELIKRTCKIFQED